MYEGTKEKLLGARKALKPLTQKVAVAVAEFAFVSPRELPDKMSPGQDALENAKGCEGPKKRGDAKTCEQV